MWPSILRFNKTKVDTIEMFTLAAAENSIKWTIDVETVYDEDSGIESLRVTHNYVGPLRATEEIRFELVYRTKSDPFTDRKIMEADSGVCKMKRSVTDTRFWTTTTEDQYYKCEAEICATASPAFVYAFPTPDKAVTDTTNNWTVPILDNNPDAPFCTPYSPSELAASPYLYQFACKQIKCIYQRPLVTKPIDPLDFQFYDVSAVGAKTDELILPAQRSSIAINYDKTTANVVFGSAKHTAIISSGAMAGLASSAAFIASMLLF